MGRAGRGGAHVGVAVGVLADVDAVGRRARERERVAPRMGPGVLIKTRNRR